MNAAKQKPAFRTIEKVAHQCDTWLAKRGDEIVAEFFYESDAKEWRANDPLNRGTIDELMQREEQRDELAKARKAPRVTPADRQLAPAKGLTIAEQIQAQMKRQQ